jgi:hypothetical protein
MVASEQDSERFFKWQFCSNKNKISKLKQFIILEVFNFKKHFVSEFFLSVNLTFFYFWERYPSFYHQKNWGKKHLSRMKGKKLLPDLDIWFLVCSQNYRRMITKLLCTQI